jgi:hypothetical protein
MNGNRVPGKNSLPQGRIFEQVEFIRAFECRHPGKEGGLTIISNSFKLADVIKSEEAMCSRRWEEQNDS